jgi:DnaJ-class molecular chaperone with C-terminal Zn finger domain
MAIAGKLIGGFLGFITSGPLGALLGAAVGALFDSMADSVNTTESREWEDNYNRSHYDQHSSGAYSSQYQQRQYEGQRNSFLFSLLVLASYIIRADGKIMHSEMEFVRNFLRTNFGDAAAQQGNAILIKLFDEQKRQNIHNPYAFKRTIQECCQQMAHNMDYSQRLQLLHFLVLIAQADGNVATEEVNALKEITRYLQMSQEDLDSMLNLRSGSTGNIDNAYKVLGITKDATDDEVKAAYRKMALKHHPDRVATLGDDMKKAAEKKFQEINAAKDLIYKARGL